MKISTLLIALFIGVNLFSQEQLTLDNLNDFKPQAGNWRIVGNVTVNPLIDVHEKHSDVKKRKPKKRKRKKTKQENLKAVSFKSGTGILLNINDSEKNDRLETVWEHGDIKLELDVMLPKGSNSGIYFQGRYELQLKDSWGVVNPKISDMGGIHNNWETEADKIFRGIPPLSNASKAPGLWQKLKIHFKAPKFNTNGEKIANAKFVSVVLNGVTIHSHIDIPQYTGGPIIKNEVPKGPLVIQGDHGPVAFKNIKYQRLSSSQVSLKTLNYKTYKGDFKGLEELQHANIVTEGISQFVDINVTGEEDAYGIVYTGKIHIPKDDNYNFYIGYTGGVSFDIDGVEAIKVNASDRQEEINETVKLSTGLHDFKLTNIKSAGWRAPRLGFSVSTATTYQKVFNTYDSYPPPINSVSPIYVSPNNKPRLLRAFVSFQDVGKRLSHTIGVGTLEGVNYIYDLGAGNLVGAWRGDFVDATPMWHERGDGSFRPMGAVQWTFLNQPVAQLSSLSEAFPKTGQAPDFESKGYIIDKHTQLPIFKYLYKGVEVTNSIKPNKANTHIINEIRLSKQTLENWYYKLASGSVQKVSDGLYCIDGQYYIKIILGEKPIVRNLGEDTELIIPINGNAIKYELIW